MSVCHLIRRACSEFLPVVRWQTGERNMRRVAFFALIWLLAGARGVRAQDVLYNFAEDTDFSKFKTYKWVSISGAQKLGEPLAKEITDAVDAELAKKGLTKTEANNADLYVGFQAATGEEKELHDLGSGWSYGPGWGAGWYGPMPKGATTVAASTIYSGQLDVDIYDGAKKQLVWRGMVSKAISEKAKPENRRKNLERAVAKLLKNYPPQKERN